MESLTPEQRALFVAGGQLGDYDVLKPIGKGKFSVVYKAKRKRDAQPIALKKIAIFDMMDAKAREKTLKEVRLVQSVSHPNIVQYLDAFIANNELHIAFEWAEAGDLKRQIRKANEKGVRFDERTIWRYFAQLCAAIRHMHEARIMHRDLKPANIFLTLQGVVKVGDLGLGRHLSEDTMEAHSKVGTPLYMSPEVLRGEGYDWKSDVWSLGCILYELAMLRSPFKSEGLNLYGLFQKINKGDYEVIPPVYSDHLRQLVTRMISLTASDRPSMEEVWGLCQTRPSSAALTEKKERIHTQVVLVTTPAAMAITAEQENEQIARTTEPGVPVTRRKKPSATRSKELPSLEETPPSSSRPPSSQQPQHDREETSASGSSRPPSSQRSTTTSNGGDSAVAIERNPDDVKQKHLEARMELLFERLKLLQYEKALHKRITAKHFLPTVASSRQSPALPQVSPQTRFADLSTLVAWLLKLLAVDAASEVTTTQQQSERSPSVMVAQMLLIGAERAGVGPQVGHLSAPALTSGCGEEVCILLDALCEKAIQANKRSFQIPSYPKETVEEIEAQDNLEIGADQGGGDWGDSTTSTPGLEMENGDDDMFAKWLVVKDEQPAEGSGGGDRNRDQQCEMITSRIDPSAWRRELERIAPKLRNRMAECLQSRPGESAWHARVEMMQRNVGFIVSASPELRHEIVQTQTVGELCVSALL